jgi:hypothetical protein
MRLYNLRVPIGEAIGTNYGTAFPLQPRNISLGDGGFTGILSTITIRCSGMNEDETYITARLTEDAEGDEVTMPDVSCGLTRGLTNTDKTTCVYKFEAQFSDDYPLYLFVATSNSEAQLEEVILSYRQAR